MSLFLLMLPDKGLDCFVLFKKNPSLQVALLELRCCFKYMCCDPVEINLSKLLGIFLL